jgi:glucokinase
LVRATVQRCRGARGRALSSRRERRPQIHVIAVDIGASGLRAATVGPHGELLQRAERTLELGATKEELRASFRGVISELGSYERARAVGVAIPGFLDRDGTVRRGVNLVEMVGMNVASEFAGASGVRDVVVIPDLAAAALAEASVRNAPERLLCVGIGSGANAALAVGERVIDLADGALGDAGHVVVEPDGPLCPCGGRGCLEALCSGIALARDGRALGLADGRAVIEAAREGHPDAMSLIKRAGTALGRAIACWAAMTVPDVVVVVGGLSSAGDLLLGPARDELARVAQPRYATGLRIKAGVLGPDATLIGAGRAAASLARSSEDVLNRKGSR